MYAIIQNNTVTDALRVDPFSIYPPAYAAQFVNAPQGVERGWLVVDGQIVPPPIEDTPPPVPMSVTPAQGLVALFALQGITETTLQAAIDQIADPVQQYTARIGVTRTTEWRRDSVTTQAMASLMGLSEADLDALFVYAAGVQA